VSAPRTRGLFGRPCGAVEDVRRLDVAVHDQRLEAERVGTTWGDEATREVEGRHYRDLVKAVREIRRERVA
jgi:hypothetical protein